MPKNPTSGGTGGRREGTRGGKGKKERRRNGSSSAVRITGPERLLAELPGLLHFTPEAPSIVVLGRQRGSENQASPVMRVDIPEEILVDVHVASALYELGAGVSPDPSAHDLRPEVAARARERGIRPGDIDSIDALLGDCVHFLSSTLLSLATEHDLDRVVVVLLVEGACRPGGIGWERADAFARMVGVGFTCRGAEVHSVLVVESIEAGAPWREMGEDAAGLGRQLDPRQGRFAAESVAEGTRLFARRADIERMYDEEEGAGRLPARGAEERPEGGAEPCDVDVALGEISRLARSGPLADDATARAAELVVAPGVCEAALRGLVAESTPIRAGRHGAEPGCSVPFGSDPLDIDLLVVLARRGTPACRGASLLLIGVAYYVRGIGVHTVVCLEAAEKTGYAPATVELVLGLIARGVGPESACRTLAEHLGEETRLAS